MNGSGKYVSHCPRCGRNAKFSWDPEQKRGVCFSGSCGVRVRGEREYRDLFEGSSQVSPLALINRHYVEAPHVETAVLSQETTDPWSHPVSRSFLSGPLPQGRGLSREVVAASGIRSDGRKLWVDLDPVCSGHPRIRYHRAADGSTPWMPVTPGQRRTSYVYGLRNWETGPDRTQLVLFEGIFDVLGTGLPGRALALMGSDLSQDLARYLSEAYSQGLRVYYWPDPDQAGYKGARTAVRVLRGWGLSCRVVDVEGRTELNPKTVGPDRALELLSVIGYEAEEQHELP